MFVCFAHVMPPRRAGSRLSDSDMECRKCRMFQSSKPLNKVNICNKHIAATDSFRITLDATQFHLNMVGALGGMAEQSDDPAERSPSTDPEMPPLVPVEPKLEPAASNAQAFGY